ncbi:isoamyl acetate-hydrolyzing esterase 1-like protein [Dinothrombium tinctorium]|uniref:Isoamyl acetate-hydrolyzing esterase 1 homolog n=1 Tax=Dinothrombium tinctorium TaxID=1965070 RepID=A0A3S3S180_9ACAR|nr:isoamyl acetate-hydrolyzing esterase 1-like protein [Dinothrombium tinctorium]
MSFDPNEGCWGALLANHFQRKADVIPRGYSGYNTTFCKIILPKVMKEFNVCDIAAFVLFLGANDASKATSQQHVSLDDYRKNLSEMINYLKSIGVDSSKIILITPPMYYHQKLVDCCAKKGEPCPERENELTRLYANTCMEVANACDVQILHLFEEMEKQQDWMDMLNDGLHFSKTGAKFLFDLLLPHLEERVHKFRGSTCQCFPLWREVDPEKPEKSLVNDD